MFYVYRRGSFDRAFTSYEAALGYATSCRSPEDFDIRPTTTRSTR